MTTRRQFLRTGGGLILSTPGIVTFSGKFLMPYAPPEVWPDKWSAARTHWDMMRARHEAMDRRAAEFHAVAYAEFVEELTAGKTANNPRQSDA